jgi:hypothetical protein
MLEWAVNAVTHTAIWTTEPLYDTRFPSEQMPLSAFLDYLAERGKVKVQVECHTLTRDAKKDEYKISNTERVGFRVKDGDVAQHHSHRKQICSDKQPFQDCSIVGVSGAGDMEGYDREGQERTQHSQLVEHQCCIPCAFRVPMQVPGVRQYDCASAACVALQAEC